MQVTMGALMEHTMRRQRQDAWDRFWKDKDGEVVIYQHPNLLLIGWVVLAIASLFTTGKVADTLWNISLAILTAWALLEVVKGVNYFRRSLGVFVLVLVLVAVFRLA